MVNSTIQLNTTAHTTHTTANDNECLAGTGIITLAVDDVVKLAVNNNTSATNLEINHDNLTLIQVSA